MNSEFPARNPTLDTAWVKWLELCDSARCTTVERGLLEDWACPKLLYLLDEIPNTGYLKDRSASNPTPCFVELEAYCHENPKTSVSTKTGKNYKLALCAMSAEESQEQARYYAARFFSAIARSKRKDEQKPDRPNPMPADWEGTFEEYIDTLCSREHGFELTHDIRHQIDLDVADAVESVFAQLSDRQRFLYWALSSGLQANDTAVLDRAGCKMATAYADITAIEKLFAKRFKSDRSLDGKAQHHLVATLFERFSEKIFSWAESENLDVAAFKQT